MQPPSSSHIPSQSPRTGFGPIRTSGGDIPRPHPYPSPSLPSRSESHTSPHPQQTQPSQTRRTRTNLLLNDFNQAYRKTNKDWAHDATPSSPSSTELLLLWLELPDHWAFYHDGKGGGTQLKGAEMASSWLRRHDCPTERSPAACQRKVGSPLFYHRR